MKQHSYTIFAEVGIDFVGLPNCRPLYASPTTVSSRTNMFFSGPSLELLHLHSRRSPELHSS